MAIYGSQIAEGKSPAQAQDFVKQVLANTSVQDSSARDSLNTFSSGKGDVLVGYENDAIQAKKDGIDLEYVTPDSTILIENPIAVTKDAPSEAQKFVDFLYTDQGQQDFADAGYRPVVKSVAREEREQVPDPVGPVHHRQVRWLGQGLRSVLRRQRLGDPGREGPRQPDQLGSWSAAMASADTAVARPPRVGLRSPLGGAVLTRGAAILWISVIVLLPLAAVFSRGFATGSGTSSTRSPTRRRWRRSSSP